MWLKKKNLINLGAKSRESIKLKALQIHFLGGRNKNGDKGKIKNDCIINKYFKNNEKCINFRSK